MRFDAVTLSWFLCKGRTSFYAVLPLAAWVMCTAAKADPGSPSSSSSYFRVESPGQLVWKLPQSSCTLQWLGARLFVAQLALQGNCPLARGASGGIAASFGAAVDGLPGATAPWRFSQVSARTGVSGYSRWEPWGSESSTTEIAAGLTQTLGFLKETTPAKTLRTSPSLFSYTQTAFRQWLSLTDNALFLSVEQIPIKSTSTIAIRFFQTHLMGPLQLQGNRPPVRAQISSWEISYGSPLGNLRAEEKNPEIRRGFWGRVGLQYAVVTWESMTFFGFIPTLQGSYTWIL